MRREREREILAPWTAHYCLSYGAVRSKTTSRQHLEITREFLSGSKSVGITQISEQGPHNPVLLEVLSVFAFPRTTDCPAVNSVLKSRTRCQAPRMLSGS